MKNLFLLLAITFLSNAVFAQMRSAFPPRDKVIVQSERSHDDGSKKHIIYISPKISDFGFGIGTGYERRFNDLHWSIYLPVDVSMGLSSFLYGSGEEGVDEKEYTYSINPMIKYYPLGYDRFFTFNVGPSVWMNYGTGIDAVLGIANQYEYYRYQESMIALMANAQVLFQPGNKVNFGFSGGVGPRLFYKWQYDDDSKTGGRKFTPFYLSAHLGIKI